MAVKIRLKRLGQKKKPFYRVVVADSRRARDGRFIEEIGYYNPVSEPKVFRVDNEKAKQWIKNGAQSTSIVEKLFKDNDSIIMKDLVELIVKELVTDKDAVEIVEDRDGGEVNILIKVAEEDKGRVIGVRGNIINSIRTIARSAAIKENVKVNIKIWESQ